MIARMWHGRVPASKAGAYREFLNTRAISDYRSVQGNISVHILERKEGDSTHFMTFTFWKDMDSIKAFAGDEDSARNVAGHKITCDGMSGLISLASWRAV